MYSLNNQLFEAAEKGDADACRDLFARGADVHTVNNYGWNALRMAANNGRTNVCQFLLEHGVDVHAVNQDGWNAMHYAAIYGRTATCILLLEYGCDPLVKTEDGKTAIDLAIAGKHEDCAQAIRSGVAANAARAALQEISAADATRSTAP